MKTPLRTIVEYVDGTKTVINYTPLGEMMPEEPYVEPIEPVVETPEPQVEETAPEITE